MVDRDDSTETAAAAKGDELAQAAEFRREDVMVPNQSDVDQRKRMSITKAAKRFERHGLVEDGQELVDLVHGITDALAGKETHVVSHRLLKKAQARAAAQEEAG